MSDPGIAAAAAAGSPLRTADRIAAVEAIVSARGESSRSAAVAGVARVADRWTAGDGDAAAFAAVCATHYVANAAERTRLLARLEETLRQIGGHLYEMRRSLRRWNDLAGDEFPGVDDVIASFDPAPDLSDQLYRQKVAFIALLNFERPDLRAMLGHGSAWNTEEWAAARVSQQFGPRIPSELSDHARRVGHEAQNFVASFHVPVGTMVDAKGKRWFEPDRALLAHWLVREEIKAGYGDPDGLDKQHALMWVMARHIDGSIPRAVMERRTAGAAWDPAHNTVGGVAVKAEDTVGPERYRHILEHHAVAGRFDPMYPEAPTAIARKFDLAREIPEADVERLLIDLLDHPVRAPLAAFLRARLGRALEPQDIYFEDVAESKPAAEMNAAVKARFADEHAFQAALPQVLRELGFPADEADFLGTRISVEIAKGSGHAMRPMLPGYGAWLRTNRLKDELGWDGFDTAMHELGHNLEQLYSAFWAPRPALQNVPNTACTEAFAFLYQSLAKRVLGMEDAAELDKQFAVDSVITMLSACQIAGPSLLELRAWRWLYANPEATAAALRTEVLRIADDLWTRFYERDFGKDGYRILAAYQHMIGHPLYLPDYTLGHMMSHQIRSYMRGKDLATETKRITSLGSLTPDLWMRRAVGTPVSAAPLASDAAAGLRQLA